MKTQIKIKHSIVLLLLLVFNGFLTASTQTTSSSSASAPEGLEKVLSTLSTIARIVNGISLQSELREHHDEVIAELLSAPSGDTIKSLKALRADDVKEALKTFQKGLEQVGELGAKSTNLSEVEKVVGVFRESSVSSGSIQMLQDLKDIEDKSIELDQLLASPPEQDYLDVKVLEQTASYLSGFKDRTFFSYTPDGLKAQLRDTLQFLKSSETEIKKMQTSETDLEQFYKMSGAPGLMSNVSELAKYARVYYNNSASLLLVKEYLEQMKSDMDPMKHFESTVINTEDLIENIFWLGNLTHRISGKDLTIGLPRGILDIEEISKDLDGAILSKLISDGKPLTRLKTMLSKLPQFHVAMSNVSEHWKQFNQSEAAELLKLPATLKMLQFEKSSEIQGMITGLQGCLKNLSNPGTTVDFKPSEDFEKLTKLETFVNHTAKRVADFRATMESLKSAGSIDTFLGKIQEMIAILEKLSNTEQVRFDELKAFKDLSFAIGKLGEIRTRIGKFQGQKGVFFKSEDLKSGRISVNVIPKTLKSLDGTEFLSTMVCTLAQDFGKLVLAISSRKILEDVKAHALNSTVQFLEQTSQTQRLLLHLNSLSNPTKNSRRRRHLPKPQINQAMNKDVGKGVKVLRDFLKILNSEELIRKVLDAPDDIQKIAQNATSSEKAWTFENQKLLRELIPELKIFEQYAISLKNYDKNLTTLWSFFTEADKVKGPFLEAALVKDPIAVHLRAQGKLVEADRFRNLSQLHLDFGAHHISLRSASLSFRALQEYFDEMFGIKRERQREVVMVETGGVDTKIASVEVSLGKVIGLVLTIIFVIAASFGAYSLHYYLRKAYRWKHRERFWIYSHFFDWGESSQNIFLAIKEDRLETVKRRIVEEDCMVNCYDNLGQTPLHCAVANLQPEMVELLITNGADRGLKNLENLTAEQVLDRMPSTAQNSDRMREVVDIYHKYKGKTFRPRVPEHFPRSRFSVELQCNTRLAEAFKKKYPDCLDSSNSKICTHVVVETDEDGVYEIDRGEPNGDPDRIAKFYVVLHPAILLQKTWAEACLLSKKNFQKDYEHRVTKIKYRGKTHETVDEWKKWMRWRAIPPLARVSLFCASDVGSAPSRYLRGLVENLGGAMMENSDAVLNQVGGATPPPFWFTERSSTWVVYSEGKKDDLETDFVNSKETLKNSTTTSLPEMFQMLISMNGFVDLEKKRKGLQLLKKGEEPHHSSSNSSLASMPSSSNNLTPSSSTVLV